MKSLDIWQNLKYVLPKSKQNFINPRGLFRWPCPQPYNFHILLWILLLKQHLNCIGTVVMKSVIYILLSLTPWVLLSNWLELQQQPATIAPTVTVIWHTVSNCGLFTQLLTVCQITVTVLKKEISLSNELMCDVLFFNPVFVVVLCLSIPLLMINSLQCYSDSLKQNKEGKKRIKHLLSFSILILMLNEKVIWGDLPSLENKKNDK